MGYTATDIIVVILLMAGSAAGAGMLAHNAVDLRWQAECIKRGVGGYDKQTGLWQWTVSRIDDDRGASPSTSKGAVHGKNATQKAAEQAAKQAENPNGESSQTTSEGNN